MSLRSDFRWGHHPLVPRSAEDHQPERRKREYNTNWARRPTARAARAGLQFLSLIPLVYGETRPMISGKEVLRELGDQPCVIVANHSSHLDTVVLLAALPKEWRYRTVVAAAADYFFDAWWRSVSTAFLLGAVPIERKGGEPSRTPARVLSRGWNVVVFPEGTRSRDGVQNRFKLGAANMAITAGVPVLPVAITGTFAAMPRGRNWPAPGRPRVGIRFGAPLRVREDEDAVAFTDRIAGTVLRLQDEGSTDWYAALRNASAAPPQPAVAPPPAAEPGCWRRTWASTVPVQPPRPSAPKVWN